MSRYARLRVNDFISTIDLSHEYTYRELQDLWGISREACRCRVRVANTAGYIIKLNTKKVQYNPAPRIHSYIFTEDLGTPGQPECPRCKASNSPDRRGSHGEVPHLYVDYTDTDKDGEPFIYCRACGYWPAGDRVSQIQIVLARYFAGHCLEAQRVRV